MDTYVDDLAELIQTLAMKDAVLIGFSASGGEVARYIGRYGTLRLAKAVLIAAVPPLMLKAEANPGGLPMEKFDAIRQGAIADRSQLYQDIAGGLFFGANRRGARPGRHPQRPAQYRSAGLPQGLRPTRVRPGK